MGRLVGRITIDDIIDVIRDEADKDYQLAAGISQDVEADDSILELTKARLPWLVLALLGGYYRTRIGIIEGRLNTETYFSSHHLLLQWQEMWSAVFCNYCARSCK
jgi:hypothetical protein